MNLEKITILREQFAILISSVSSLDDVEKVKQSFLGKHGFIIELLKTLKSIQDPEKKAEAGRLINDFKNECSLKVEELESLFLSQKIEKQIDSTKQFDVTAHLPDVTLAGNLHLYTKFYQEIENIFISMGFQIFEGPEVENDFYNFTALNISANHPARDMYDTLWLNRADSLLRTHTSSVQIRAMQSLGAPLAGISIGRVFRHEAVDATHEVVFSQCEGLFIDKDVNISHLLGIAKSVLQRIFDKKNLDIRVRPGFFPFVVPGLEIDMQCVFCKSGCSICKYSTWIEVFPGGLIHPKVLEHGGIDSTKYSGFAFGFGVDRLMMLRHQITDIRLFKSGDVRFLNQF